MTSSRMAGEACWSPPRTRAWIWRWRREKSRKCCMEGRSRLSAPRLWPRLLAGARGVDPNRDTCRGRRCQSNGRPIGSSDSWLHPQKFAPSLLTSFSQSPANVFPVYAYRYPNTPKALSVSTIRAHPQRLITATPPMLCWHPLS